MNAAGAFLGLDLGGTGAKAGVFDASGKLLGLGHQSIRVTVSPDGHAEVPIEAVYDAAKSAVGQALSQAGRPAVRAISVSSQGQTFVTLDDRDHPLHPAIIWYDSRATAESAWLDQAVPRNLPQRPRIETIAAAPKILWLRKHLPEAMRRARRYLLLPDYIAYRLTGEAATDTITASTTALLAEGADTYCPEALAAAGISAGQLARPVPAGTPIGRITPAAAEEWGLRPDTLMVAGTNDQFAGALGAGNCRPGILSETSGTCLALVTLVERLPEPRPAGLFGGLFPIRPYRYALAYSKTAGVVLDWFRREFCPNETWDQLRALASSSPPGSRGIVMMPHFDGAVSPEPNPAVRGAFAGLGLQHGRADLFRSILEGLAYSLRENTEFLEAQGFPLRTVRSIGGGAKDEVWLQIKADVLGRAIEQPAVTEAAVLGAAMLAACGQGEFASLAEASRGFYRAARTFEPDSARHAVYETAYRRYLDLKDGLLRPPCLAALA